jgi:hypothetical protein
MMNVAASFRLDLLSSSQKAQRVFTSTHPEAAT